MEESVEGDKWFGKNTMRKEKREKETHIAKERETETGWETGDRDTGRQRSEHIQSLPRSVHREGWGASMTTGNGVLSSQALVMKHTAPPKGVGLLDQNGCFQDWKQETAG